MFARGIGAERRGLDANARTGNAADRPVRQSGDGRALASVNPRIIVSASTFPMSAFRREAALRVRRSANPARRLSHVADDFDIGPETGAAVHSCPVRGLCAVVRNSAVAADRSGGDVDAADRHQSGTRRQAHRNGAGQAGAGPIRLLGEDDAQRRSRPIHAEATAGSRSRGGRAAADRRTGRPRHADCFGRGTARRTGDVPAARQSGWIRGDGDRLDRASVHTRLSCGVSSSS